MIFSHDLHLTLTFFPGKRMNLFEPQSGQIGQARTGSISVQ